MRRHAPKKKRGPEPGDVAFRLGGLLIGGLVAFAIFSNYDVLRDRVAGWIDVARNGPAPVPSALPERPQPENETIEVRAPEVVPTPDLPPEQPGQAASRADRRASTAVVPDGERQHVVRLADVDDGAGGAAVLGRVGEELGGAEVDDGLDGRRGADRQVHPQLHGERPVRGERHQGGVQALVEGGWMDAPHQVAQIHDGRPGDAAGGVRPTRRRAHVPGLLSAHQRLCALGR